MININKQYLYEGRQLAVIADQLKLLQRAYRQNADQSRLHDFASFFYNLQLTVDTRRNLCV